MKHSETWFVRDLRLNCFQSLVLMFFNFLKLKKPFVTFVEVIPK